MEIVYFNKGFNYSQDGPGNRLVVHLSGCNMRCPWCSNPEGIQLSDGKAVDVDKILAEIISCKRLFIDGGGVTFTGGECTFQKQALAYLVKGCNKNSIHVAIETNGTCELDNELFENIDLIICDYKHYNEDKLFSVCGGNKLGYKNLVSYIKSGKKVLVRTVLVNGFNASESDAKEFAKRFDGLDCKNVQFEFLPYHEYGKYKWEKLGKEYTVKDGFVTESTVRMFENVYKKHNLKTIRS